MLVSDKQAIVEAAIVVHYCAAFGCCNNSTDSHLSFHSFPKEKQLIEVSSFASFRLCTIKIFPVGVCFYPAATGLNNHCAGVTVNYHLNSP